MIQGRQTIARLLAVLAITLLACDGVRAQSWDDASIRKQIISGNYEPLRALEAAAARGDVTAMFWWGRLRGGCVFGPCDAALMNQLLDKAAAAGHDEAWLQRSVALPGDQLVARIEALRPPMGESQMTMRANLLLTRVRYARDEETRTRSFTDFQALGAPVDLRLRLAMIESFDGLMRNADELRSMVETGFPPAAPVYRRAMLLKLGTRGQPNFLSRPQALAAQDFALAVAGCTDYADQWGRPRHGLTADVLAMCERVAAAGYPGAYYILALHHVQMGNYRAALFYAEQCEHYDITQCADERLGALEALAAQTPDPRTMGDLDFYRRLRQHAGARVEDAINGKADADVNWPEPQARRIMSLRVAAAGSLRACLRARRDSEGRWRKDAECPWMRPLAIPPQFLGGPVAKD